MDWILRSIKTKLTLGVISSVVVLLAVLLAMSYTSLKSYSLNNALELSETILNDTDNVQSKIPTINYPMRHRNNFTNERSKLITATASARAIQDL